MHKRTTWSLLAELQVIGAAVEGARVLSEAVATEQLASERDTRAASETVSSVLTIVVVRLRDIERMMRGEIEPETLRAAHNATDEDGYADHDVVFAAD